MDNVQKANNYVTFRCLKQLKEKTTKITRLSVTAPKLHPGPHVLFHKIFSTFRNVGPSSNVVCSLNFGKES
jgi:hypothetical protein